MKQTNLTIALTVSSLLWLSPLSPFGANAYAQSGADYLNAFKPTECVIPFDVNAEGQPFRVFWGMDTAWNSEGNVRRGVNHIGVENFSTGRLSYQPTYKLIQKTDGTFDLTAEQKKMLQTRITNLKLTGVTEANINCDNAAAFDELSDGTTGYENYGRDANAWYQLIKASVKFIQDRGIKIISVSPFNEPDYDENKYWFKSTFLEVSRLIKADPFFDGIRICGGNTLNCDRAWDWYEDLREVLDEGNTHQLAGSFDNYADFFTKVRADGRMAANDELHNVGEAIVGVQYGMQTGIWWGFDSHARGQFCRDSQEGVRLGYGENRANWTSGAVYRNDRTGEVHAYMGSSERQAYNSSFTFVSLDRDVYFDGRGPARHFAFDIPGGTGYQKGQTNAERVIDITWGMDVQPDTINGTYQLMCRSGRRVLSVTNTAATSGTQICAKKGTTGTYDDWIVQPVSPRVGGDFGYFYLKNAKSGLPIDGWNWGLTSGSELRVFDGSFGDNEQWYLKYAGDGYYYIINRYSNLYLTASGTSAGALVNQSVLATTDAKRQLQQWRIIPTDAACEINPPSVPNGLQVVPQTASVSLSWNPCEDDDLAGYFVLRKDKETGLWNTIARKLTATTFVDNNLQQGRAYQYAVRAIDRSDNLSALSDSVDAETLTAHAMIAYWPFDENLADRTENHMDVALYGTEKITTLSSMVKVGTGSLFLDGASYVQLPYQVASSPELTVCFWVRWTGNTAGDAQRLFDFGYDDSHCLYLSPSEKNKMRLVMRNGTEEHVIEAQKLGSTWRHVAVTFAADAVRIYVNGEVVAQSDNSSLFALHSSLSLLNYLGRSQRGDAPGFKGYFDDFRIYNYALTSAALSSLANEVREDVNLDGIVDTQDVLAVYEYMRTASQTPNVSSPADINQDGMVDTQDVLKIYEYINQH
ncbi:MAG: RICIN domain-containing protein [Bacteroidaceae bacterium]|nr:RICIN domain-containing protein [Bacteroidaceae bacterium]